MYRDLRDDYDLPPPSRYSRDYFDDPPASRLSTRYDDRDRLSSRYGPPSVLDDPFYLRDEPLLPRPKEPLSASSRFGFDVEPGAYVQGSVMIIPPPPFASKPPRREKPTKCDTIFVGSLPENMTEKNLYDAFVECGPIQDVRIARGRHFGHVEFRHESSIDKAIDLAGYTIRIGPSGTSADEGKLHIDYAQSRAESDAKRRMKSGDPLLFNAPNAAIISSDLRQEETFDFARKNLVHWLEERGNCTPSTANTFFGLLSSVNTHCHKLSKNVKALEDDLQEYIKKKNRNLSHLLAQCDDVDNVFEVVMQQKVWSNFTKPQRKSITQWKEHIQEIRAQINQATESPSEKDDELPQSKKLKLDVGDEKTAQMELDRAEREIEQLKVDHEIAIEKREKQILQLKTLLARFKQNCPDEWESIVGGSGQVGSEGEGKLKNTKKEDRRNGANKKGEVIDGVNLEDLNSALEGGALGSSLAEAAKAYAQIRSQLGSSGAESGLGLTEDEVAMVAVMAAFLTVHPLGSSLAEISQYFLTLSSNYNSVYLESLLHRLPKVFQLSQGANREPRWWFLGFQTVSVGQFNSVGVPGGNDAQTVEMGASSA